MDIFVTYRDKSCRCLCGFCILTSNAGSTEDEHIESGKPIWYWDWLFLIGNDFIKILVASRKPNTIIEEIDEAVFQENRLCNTLN
jgi:hypothetical protein